MKEYFLLDSDNILEKYKRAKLDDFGGIIVKYYNENEKTMMEGIYKIENFLNSYDFIYIKTDKSTNAEIIPSKKNDIQSDFRSTEIYYNTIYCKLINVINPSPGIEGKKMDITEVKYMIQLIYSQKFLDDTKSIFNKEDVEPTSFPEFVGNFFVNKYPKKEFLHKKVVDFIFSLDFYGLKDKDIKIFQKFVIEEYDEEDLIFYLFFRSCIEKELKVFFLEKVRKNSGRGMIDAKEDDDIMVPVKKCKKLAKAVFGSEEKDLINTFMEGIKNLLEADSNDKNKKYLKANAILNKCLNNYHNSSKEIDEGNKDQEKDSNEDEKVKEKVKENHKKLGYFYQKINCSLKVKIT